MSVQAWAQVYAWQWRFYSRASATLRQARPAAVPLQYGGALTAASVLQYTPAPARALQYKAPSVTTRQYMQLRLLNISELTSVLQEYKGTAHVKTMERLCTQSIALVRGRPQQFRQVLHMGVHVIAPWEYRRDARWKRAAGLIGRLDQRQRGCAPQNREGWP